jgi:gliding motility-associated-like protein
VAPYQYSLDGIVFQTSPVFSGLPAGTHSLIILDAVDCEWDTTIIINDGIELMLNVGPDLELDFGDMADLHATIVPPGIIDSLIWDPSDALSCNNCLDPVLTALYQHNFVVTATAYAGNCVDTDDLLVIVDSEFDIFVPNVFSPNNDNINDFVTAFGGNEVVQILEFEIFDRWGELIFRNQFFPLNEPELGWDGKFKGELMNPGVFVYKLKVELIDGSELILSGDITLVR